MIRRYMPAWTLPLLVIFAIGSVWLRLKVVRTTYEINETEKSLAEGRQEQERLELKVAQLRSPRRLELLAKSKFRLNPPKIDQVIRLSRSSAVTKAEKARE